MKYLLYIYMIFILMSCNQKENESNNLSELTINSALKQEVVNYSLKLYQECGITTADLKRSVVHIGNRSITSNEKDKYLSCLDNISNISCNDERLKNFDLMDIENCFYYENTKGFPTAKTSCETNMTGFCQAPRSCVDGVSCEVYQGGMPFRQGCAEPHTGAYTCTGDYDNAPFCKPFWVEYTSGCHDDAGYVKENSFDNLCDKFGNVLLINDDSIVEQFNNCFNAIPHQGDYYTCEDLYDINYDISTITECQFIFAK